MRECASTAGGGTKAAEKYAALIKEADGLFGKKDYASAKTKYNEAIALNDKEAYPNRR